jgi:hypothetical protein
MRPRSNLHSRPEISGDPYYASLGWFSPLEARPEPHYPSIKPELIELTGALHGLAHDGASRATFLADAAATPIASA